MPKQKKSKEKSGEVKEQDAIAQVQDNQEQADSMIGGGDYVGALKHVICNPPVTKSDETKVY